MDCRPRALSRVVVVGQGAQDTVVVSRPGIGGTAPGGELGAARVPRDSDGTPRPALPATPAEPIGRTATT